MKTQKNTFIFEATNQICGLSQSQSISDVVLKEIESPDGIRWYTDFGKSNLVYYFNSVRAFCCHNFAKYTFIFQMFGSGNFFHQQKIKVMFKTSDLKPMRNTLTETTDVDSLNCGLYFPSIFSKRGKIEGGRNFITSAHHFFHSVCSFPKISLNESNV